MIHVYNESESLFINNLMLPLNYEWFDNKVKLRERFYKSQINRLFYANFKL